MLWKGQPLPSPSRKRPQQHQWSGGRVHRCHRSASVSILEMHTLMATNNQSCWVTSVVSGWLAMHSRGPAMPSVRSHNLILTGAAGVLAICLLHHEPEILKLRPEKEPGTCKQIRYSLAGQDTRPSPERPGFESRWRNFVSHSIGYST